VKRSKRGIPGLHGAPAMAPCKPPPGRAPCFKHQVRSLSAAAAAHRRCCSEGRGRRPARRCMRAGLPTADPGEPRIASRYRRSKGHRPIIGDCEACGEICCPAVGFLFALCTLVHRSFPTGKCRINPSPPGSWHFIGDGETERAPAQHEPGVGYAAAATPSQAT
jgi:hypothetical protein